MKSKLVAQSAGERTFVLVLDPGEEAFAAISKLAKETRLAPHRSPHSGPSRRRLPGGLTSPPNLPQDPG